MATFENPNSPKQPQCGVYGWYARKDGQHETVIYIGMAGGRKCFSEKGTLFRGVCELQRNTFTSNAPAYDQLDTDFIVGTAVLYFESKGYTCSWKHLSNNPSEEKKFVLEQKPVLQNTADAKIKSAFRIKKQEHGYWWSRRNNAAGMTEAQRDLFDVLDKETGYIANGATVAG